MPETFGAHLTHWRTNTNDNKGLNRMSDIHPELQELDRRIESTIPRVPDRLSTDAGRAIRAGWAREFARLLGAEVMPVRHFALLPFHLHLLTDPVLMRLPTGYLVLDHPLTAEQFSWAFNIGRVHDCPRWWTLYGNRHPRLIIVPDPGGALSLTDKLNRLSREGWHGPFEAPPTWAVVVPHSGPMRSLVRVEHPVDPAWFAQI
jgi:hypothetical protein